MKQHISPKQLMEVDRFDLAEYFPNSSFGYYERSTYYQFHCKKITIGKMIEILGNNIAIVQNTIFQTDGEPNPFWHVALCDNECSGYSKKELCDSLWEAVKYTLNNKQMK